MNLNRIKLLVLSLCALAFACPLELRTANAKPASQKDGPLPDEKAPEPDSELGLLCKGAGVDWKDVTWRVRAGLTAKQAVEVALNEKREAAGEQPNELSPTEVSKLKDGETITDTSSFAAAERVDLDKKTVAQLKKIAADRKVELTADMKKADIIAAIEGAGTE